MNNKKTLKIILIIATIIFHYTYQYSYANIKSKKNLNCHPEINTKINNFMIGYGSLMESESRKRTNLDAQYVYPIMVQGFKRLWGIGSDKYGITFLTIIKSKNSYFNGVYYSTNYNSILATDNRESSYCRIKVNYNQIKPLGLNSLPKGTYWIYAQKDNNTIKPSSKRPIVQSYVDIFLNGCIQVGQQFELHNFLKQCIETTKGWPNNNNNKFAWVNDRVNARRPFATPNAFKIDRILSKKFKNYYNHPKSS